MCDCGGGAHGERAGGDKMQSGTLVTVCTASPSAQQCGVTPSSRIMRSKRARLGAQVTAKRVPVTRVTA